MKAKIVYRACVAILVFLMAAAVLPARPALAQTVCLQVNGEGLPDGAPIPGWDLVFGGPPPIANIAATADSVGIHSGDRGVRVNGDYHAGKELDIVAKGIVTIDYWHFPKPGSSTNSQFSLYGGEHPGDQGVDYWCYLSVHKNDEDLWWVTDEGHPPSVASYSGEYTHIVITINTDTGLFDLHIDEELVYQGTVEYADRIEASGIRYVSVHSGRGGIGQDSYFDDILITADVPPADDHGRWPDCTPVSCPSTTSGTIEVGGDYDNFCFPGQAGTTYNTRVILGSLSAGYIRIWHQDGSGGLCSSAEGDCTWTADSTETYYVEVWGSGTGTYQMEVSEQEPCYINVTSPGGAENWKLGSTHSIIWSSSNAGSNVKIELYKDSTHYQTIAGSTSNDGSYSWAIPSSYDDYSSYRIKITDTGDSSCYGYSDGYFTLSEEEVCSIAVTSPHGGENWELGSTHSITWSSSNAGSNVKIELYRGSSYYQTIAGSTSNVGSYSWTIPSDYDEYSSYVIKISDTSDSSCYDYSDGYFTLFEEEVCSIAVTSPHGGENWELGSTHSITWSSSNAGSNVKIELYKDSSPYQIIANSTSNVGSYSWEIPPKYDEYDSYGIKITDTGDSSCYGYTDGYFGLYYEGPRAGTPSNPSPPNHATGISIYTNLDWADCANATSYQVLWGPVSPTDPAFYHGTSDSYCSLPKLDYNEEYQWKVVAIDSRGVSTPGSLWDFTTQTPPDTPSNKSPEDRATGVSLPLALQSSVFIDPDEGDDHSASEWQITTVSSNYSPPFFQSGMDNVNLTRFPIASAILNHSTVYYWRVRYQDSHQNWSEWSQETQFRTAASGDSPDLSVFEPKIDGLSVIVDGVVFPGAHGTTITRIRWDWGDGDSEDHWFAASHTYDQPGEYEITVTAYQSDGSYSTETKQISLGAPPNGWRRFVLPGATVLAAIMLLGIVWGNTTLRMRRKMRRWEQEGYDLSDWR